MESENVIKIFKRNNFEKATKEKQANGTYKNVYTDIQTYNVQMQNLTDDEISATIYGAKINKMMRLTSPLNRLEKYLLPKVDNKQDNISDYYIEQNDKTYKITSVSKDRIDIELVNSKSEILSL